MNQTEEYIQQDQVARVPVGKLIRLFWRMLWDQMHKHFPQTPRL